SETFSKNLTLNLITRGGQVVNEYDEIHLLETAAILGLGRLIGNEFPNWNVRLIDFEGGKDTPISKEAWKIALTKMNTTKRLFEEIAIREDRLYKKVMRKKQKEDEK